MQFACQHDVHAKQNLQRNFPDAFGPGSGENKTKSPSNLPPASKNHLKTNCANFPGGRSSRLARPAFSTDAAPPEANRGKFLSTTGNPLTIFAAQRTAPNKL
jgi:hypothetical protein